MVRTADAKFGFWLAGYYEDWLGSRCVADDGNAPSTDGAYNDTDTHHGNVMNGEATLNPRFRWSVRDRTASGEWTDSTNYLLLNDGVARWATFDSTRLGKGAKWAGRSQLQFPSSLAHPNRLRYDDAGVASTDPTYLTVTSSQDTSAHYHIPGGDTDAMYGRVANYTFNGRNWAAGQAGHISTGTSPDFMQSAHLTGVWTGERGQARAYDPTTGNTNATHHDYPERLFSQIKSHAGKPFLCIRTYMNEDDDHRLDNVTPTGADRPLISYPNSLNSRADGDTFGIRMAVHSHNGLPSTPQPNGQEEGALTAAPVEYTLRVGFPSNTVFDPTTGSSGATPAIEWVFRPDDGHGLSATAPYYHMEFDASQPQPSVEPWFDLDFVVDYTAGTFKVYHDGTEVTATNDGAGAYSSGYALGGSIPANAMTGWEMFATNYDANFPKAIINTLIDRVAMYRPLTDVHGNINPSPVAAWDCTMPVNGISTGEIAILDDTTEQDLTPFFSDEAIADLWLLMFSGNIHRPLWRGVIESMDVVQDSMRQTREIRLSARDSLALLDRQIAAWEIGQIGSGESDVVLARRNEVQTLSDAMFMGAARLESRDPTLGFEASDYAELQGQRPTRTSAHPVQVYNNEDVDGPNNAEREWLGYGIVAFNKGTGSEVEAIINGDLPTATQVGDNIEIFGSENYDGQYSLGIGQASSSSNTLQGVPATYDIQEIPGATWVGNTTATLQEVASAPTLLTSVPTITDHVYLIFSQRPTHGDGTFLKQGDHIIITEHERNANPSLGSNWGLFNIVAHEYDANGKWAVLTDRSSNGASFSRTAGYDFGTEKGFFAPTDESIDYRDAHAVWMRDLPKSPWVKKQFGVYDYAYLTTDTLQSACTASTKSLHVTASLVGDLTNNKNGVGQIVDTDGFVDTFTYAGVVPTAGDGNAYLIGVRGLSRDHSTSAQVYILTTSNDYKHLWVLWADMRNNGDADAHGGERKNTFGLLQPVRENYDFNIAFSDSFDNKGSYESFTDLKIEEDVDVWDVDATEDPSTGLPFSKPLTATDDAGEIINNSGKAIGEDLTNGGIVFRVTTSYASGLTVGDEIAIIDSGTYDGVHTISHITGATNPFITCDATTYTTDVAWTGYGKGPYVLIPEADYRVADLEAWESKGGAMLIIDAAPFFNLNTFTNGGTFGQVAGGRTNLGDYDTEYHGFPILMDRYWSEAVSHYGNNEAPYSFHPNHWKWNNEAAELNRTIRIGDTVIETKPSVSLIENFPPYGIGRIKATRGKETQVPSTEFFYYSWEGKKDTSTVDTATADTPAGTSPFVITCSGADFVNDGVEVGMRVRNVTAKWVAQITAVTATTITITEADIFAETGSTRQDVLNTDSIAIPQQLYGVKMVADSANGWTPQEAEDYMVGYVLLDSAGANGARAGIKVNVNNSNITSAFDEVIIGASVSPRYALRFMMNIDGFMETPGSGTYWMSDKTRFMWSLMLADTWLTQASVPCWFDFSTVPMSQGMTVDGTNANADSFGSTNDARGGKSILNILREANESVGSGYDGNHNLASTYQMGRDNALEIRPSYNCGEVLNRDNLKMSSMNASMSGQISNVRVYYNNGASFADYPEAALGTSLRWSIVEMPEITSHIEATYVAKEQYRKAKSKKVSVTGDIIRDLDDDDKMLGGRYGYVADVTREMERSAVQQAVFGPTGVAPSADFNAVWYGQTGCLTPGMVNALDGNLGTNGTDAYLRTRYGTTDTSLTGGLLGQTETHGNWATWWGANSLAHAVQIVHVPTGTPLVSDATGNDLRIWVALKDGQTGTNIDSAEFIVGISDLEFDNSPQTPFINYYSGNSQFSPSKSATLATNGYESVEVSRNGYYEVDVPASYGALAGAAFVLSVNVDYLRDLLRHRCGNPSGSGILHNAHDITEVGPSSWTATNADSIFPLGMRKFSNMSGAYDVRAAWYAPRIHVVEDIRWRPATTVAYTDSGLGLSSEPMSVRSITWSVTGRDVEQLSLNLERDQSIGAGGLLSYLFPSVARRRGNTSSSTGVGQGSGSGRSLGPVTVGPVGGTVGGGGFIPTPSQGGFAITGIGSGGFGTSYGANAFSSGVVNSMRGRMNTGDLGLSSSSFSILGQNKIPAPTNTQRAIDGFDSSISPASAGATQTAEGWVFPGIVNPEVSDRFTHTQTMNVRVPDDAADEIVTVSGTYSLGGTISDTAVVTVILTCTETGVSETITTNLSGNASRRQRVFGIASIDGLSTAGNTLSVEVKRTPGSGDDDAEYAALVMHNVSVTFQRFSVKGFSNGSAFSPY